MIKEWLKRHFSKAQNRTQTQQPENAVQVEVPDDGVEAARLAAEEALVAEEQRIHARDATIKELATAIENYSPGDSERCEHNLRPVQGALKELCLNHINDPVVPDIVNTTIQIIEQKRSDALQAYPDNSYEDFVWDLYQELNWKNKEIALLLARKLVIGIDTKDNIASSKLRSLSQFEEIEEAVFEKLSAVWAEMEPAKAFENAVIMFWNCQSQSLGARLLPLLEALLDDAAVKNERKIEALRDLGDYPRLADEITNWARERWLNYVTEELPSNVSYDEIKTVLTKESYDRQYKAYKNIIPNALNALLILAEKWPVHEEKQDYFYYSRYYYPTRGDALSLVLIHSPSDSIQEQQASEMWQKWLRNAELKQALQYIAGLNKDLSETRKFVREDDLTLAKTLVEEHQDRKATVEAVRVFVAQVHPQSHRQHQIAETATKLWKKMLRIEMSPEEAVKEIISAIHDDYLRVSIQKNEGVALMCEMIPHLPQGAAGVDLLYKASAYADMARLDRNDVARPLANAWGNLVRTLDAESALTRVRSVMKNHPDDYLGEIACGIEKDLCKTVACGITPQDFLSKFGNGPQ